MRSAAFGESGTPLSLGRPRQARVFLVVPDPPGRRGRPRVLLPLTIGGVDAEQAVREFRERSVSACGRPAGSTFYVACDLARDLTMPTANPAVVDRVEEARFRIIVRPEAPPLSFHNVAATSNGCAVAVALGAVAMESPLRLLRRCFLPRHVFP